MYNRTLHSHFRRPIQEREAMRDWLTDKHFTHFVTLTSNNQVLSRELMKKRLRSWDARVNRAIVGPKWHKRYDERINWIAFPEKQNTNPHWHLLLQLLNEQIATFDVPGDNGQTPFEKVVASSWISQLPSGSTDVCRIHNKAAAYKYASKSLGYGPHFEDFVISLEYLNT